jgi:Tfp pilus assembly protein PilN
VELLMKQMFVFSLPWRNFRCNLTNFQLFTKNCDFLPFVLQLAIMVTLKIFENH